MAKKEEKPKVESTQEASKAKEKEDKRLAKPGVTVELVKGDQWTDDLSGISLYRGFYQMATQSDIKADKEVAERGYIGLEKELKPTTVLPEGKDLKRVEHALKLGILKIYDPKNPTVYVERGEGQGQAIYDANETEKGFRYRRDEDQRILNFLRLPLEKFKEEILKIKSQKTMEKLYNAEYAGRNQEARPRKSYVDIIKSHMKSGKVGGVGNVQSGEEERISLG
jgi:hypothetical protein